MYHCVSLSLVVGSELNFFLFSCWLELLKTSGEWIRILEKIIYTTNKVLWKNGFTSFQQVNAIFTEITFENSSKWMTSLQKSHLKTPASECHLYRNHIRKQNHYQQSKTHILHMHYTINYLNCELTGDSFECYRQY